MGVCGKARRALVATQSPCHAEPIETVAKRCAVRKNDMVVNELVNDWKKKSLRLRYPLSAIASPRKYDQLGCTLVRARSELAVFRCANIDRQSLGNDRRLFNLQEQ